MEVVVIRNNLKDGLGIIQGAVGDNLKLPVLKYALFEAEADRIRFTAANLEIAITSVVLGKVIEKGKMGVPVSTLLNLINNIQTERISLQGKGGQINLKTDNYEALIQTISPEDFPTIPKLKLKNKFFEVEGWILRDALAQVVVATQFSELRPELNSVLFDFSIDSLKLAATDSFRLAEKTIPSSQFKTNQEDSVRFLVPLRTCHELLRVIKEDPVRIYFESNQVFFEAPSFEFISRLIEGNFPDYTQVLPKKFGSEVVLNKEKFINAIKLAGVFGGQNNEVRLRVLDGGKAVELKSSNQDVGENRYALPAKASRETGEVAFNGKYLLDALRVLKTEEVSLGVNEEERKATLLKSPNESSYFYILMPILKA